MGIAASARSDAAAEAHILGEIAVLRAQDRTLIGLTYWQQQASESDAESPPDGV